MLILFVLCVFVSVIWGGISETETNPCAEDISNICGMPFPVDDLAVYDTRLCLKENSLHVSIKCQDYVSSLTPSIIEPCFNEIRTFCKNVQPGANRIHTCLSMHENELTEECSVALSLDEPTSSIQIDFSSKIEERPAVLLLTHLDSLNESILTKMFTITKLQHKQSKVAMYELPSYAYLLLQELYSQMNLLEDMALDILQSSGESQTLLDDSEEVTAMNYEDDVVIVVGEQNEGRM